MKSKNTKMISDLYSAILDLKNPDETRRFFRDLLTEAEIAEFANRFRVAKMLYQKKPYSEIESKTGMSSTTIARVSKWLYSGKNGYKLILERVDNHHHGHSLLGNVS